jgi:hypothetical protein
VRRIDIDLDRMVEWCMKKKRSLDAEAVRAYVAERMCELLDREEGDLA